MNLDGSSSNYMSWSSGKWASIHVLEVGFITKIEHSSDTKKERTTSVTKNYHSSHVCEELSAQIKIKRYGKPSIKYSWIAILVFGQFRKGKPMEELKRKHLEGGTKLALVFAADIMPDISRIVQKETLPFNLRPRTLSLLGPDIDWWLVRRRLASSP